MDDTKFQEIINSINSKLDENSQGLIADDLATLVANNSSQNTTINNKDTEIQNLNTQNANLIKANGNLLQQVVTSNSNAQNSQNNENEKDKEISYDDIFDEKGNFK